MLLTRVVYVLWVAPPIDHRWQLTQPQLQPALLRLSAIVSQYFPLDSVRTFAWIFARDCVPPALGSFFLAAL